MVGISPSSVIAPVFTYYLGGDRALGVSLCLLSTILGKLSIKIKKKIINLVSGEVLK